MVQYILDGKNPVKEPDLLKWVKWFEQENARRVRVTRIGDVAISTVFLGLDHSCDFGKTPHVPVLFETMVFGGPLDQEQDCYCTWDEAEAGHERMVGRVQQEMKHDCRS